MANEKSDKNLTPWFPGDVKPVRPGVYITRLWESQGGMFAYWSGKHWGWRQPTAESAAAFGVSGHDRAEQSKQWRGLAQQPKEQA